MILATSSCISIACFPEQDGATEVILGDSTEVHEKGKLPELIASR
jgi:hypothetical protein